MKPSDPEVHKTENCDHFERRSLHKALVRFQAMCTTWSSCNYNKLLALAVRAAPYSNLCVCV